MTSVPERAAPVFSVALSWIWPLPIPSVPLEIVTHVVFEAALQAHPVWVVTSTCSGLAENETSLNSVGATWKVQGTGAGGSGTAGPGAGSGTGADVTGASFWLTAITPDGNSTDPVRAGPALLLIRREISVGPTPRIAGVISIH